MLLHSTALSPFNSRLFSSVMAEALEEEKKISSGNAVCTFIPLVFATLEIGKGSLCVRGLHSPVVHVWNAEEKAAHRQTAAGAVWLRVTSLECELLHEALALGADEAEAK